MTRFGKTNGVRNLIPYATLISVSLAATLRVEHSCSGTNPSGGESVQEPAIGSCSGPTVVCADNLLRVMEPGV